MSSFEKAFNKELINYKFALLNLERVKKNNANPRYPACSALYIKNATKELDEATHRLDTFRELDRARSSSSASTVEYTPPPPDLFIDDIKKQVTENCKYQKSGEHDGVCEQLSENLIKRRAPSHIDRIAYDYDGFDNTGERRKKHKFEQSKPHVVKLADIFATCEVPVDILSRDFTYFDVATKAFGSITDDERTKLLHQDLIILITPLDIYGNRLNFGHCISLINGLVCDPNHPNAAPLGSTEDKLMLHSLANFFRRDGAYAIRYDFQCPLDTYSNTPIVGFGKNKRVAYRGDDG